MLFFDIIEDELYCDEDKKRKVVKEKKVPHACGRAVCCGKHKKCQCACSKKEEREHN